MKKNQAISIVDTPKKEIPEDQFCDIEDLRSAVKIINDLIDFIPFSSGTHQVHIKEIMRLNKAIGAELCRGFLPLLVALLATFPPSYMSVTKNLAEFGCREYGLAAELLEAMADGKIPDNFDE